MKHSYFLTILFLLSNILISAQEINWMTLEEAENANKQEPRKIFIDVYTDWCGWCKRMDATTFKDEKIIAYLNNNYYNVKLNGEDKNTLKFKGVEFNYVKQSSRKGYNELAAGFLQGKMTYPSLVILNEELAVLQVFNGYQTSKELYPIIEFLGDDIYKEKKWNAYLKETKKTK